MRQKTAAECLFYMEALLKTQHEAVIEAGLTCCCSLMLWARKYPCVPALDEISGLSSQTAKRLGCRWKYGNSQGVPQSKLGVLTKLLT